MLMPFQILGMWLRGLFAVLLLAVGISLLALWFNNREYTVTVPRSESRPKEQIEAPPSEIRTVSWKFGFNKETAFLVGGCALLAWSLAGQWIFSPSLWRRRGHDEPRSELIGEVHSIRMEDGNSILVEAFGPVEGEPIIFVHGWGTPMLRASSTAISSRQTCSSRNATAKTGFSSLTSAWPAPKRIPR